MNQSSSRMHGHCEMKVVAGFVSVGVIATSG